MLIVLAMVAREVHIERGMSRFPELVLWIGWRDECSRANFSDYCHAAWAICALLAYLGVFRCLDIMARIGLTAIVFPIGVGTCIIVFLVYSHICLREPYTKTTIMGLCLAVIGIIFMALR